LTLLRLFSELEDEEEAVETEAAGEETEVENVGDPQGIPEWLTEKLGRLCIETNEEIVGADREIAAAKSAAAMSRLDLEAS